MPGHVFKGTVSAVPAKNIVAIVRDVEVGIAVPVVVEDRDASDHRFGQILARSSRRFVLEVAAGLFRSIDECRQGSLRENVWASGREASAATNKADKVNGAFIDLL